MDFPFVLTLHIEGLRLIYRHGWSKTEATYMLRRLPPLQANLGKRLVKSPKFICEKHMGVSNIASSGVFLLFGVIRRRKSSNTFQVFLT